MPAPPGVPVSSLEAAIDAIHDWNSEIAAWGVILLILASGLALYSPPHLRPPSPRAGSAGQVLTVLFSLAAGVVAGPSSPAVARTDTAEATAPLWLGLDLASALLGGAAAAAGMAVFRLWRGRRSPGLARRPGRTEERGTVSGHYEQLIRGARDIFLLADPDGDIVEFNDSALAAYGYGAEEFRGRNLRDLQAPASGKSFSRDWESAGTTGSLLARTYHRRKDGTEFPVEISSHDIAIDGRPYRQNAIRVISVRERLEASVRRMTRVLSAAQIATRVLLKARSEEELYRDMCETIVSVGGYRMADVGLAEQDEAKSVRFVAVSGTDDGYLAGSGITWGDGILGSGPTGSAIRSGAIQVCQNFAADERMRPWREAALARGFQASIALPLSDSGTVVGALTIYAAQPDAFDSDEVDLLAAFADDLSYGVSALRNRREADAAASRLRESMEKTISVLADAMEVRDPYTSGHQARVAQLGRAIAEELGLPGEQVRGIFFGGLIHDIGKISCPAELLSKPGKLTTIEYDLIKQHPRIGGEIVRSVAFPWPVADMIRDHHERLDGSGYPDGLEGDAISLGGRILAVADVVEAMMSHRPYRPALGLDAALEEIRGGRGRIYDVAAVDACIALFGESRFAFGADSDRPTRRDGPT